MSNYGEMMEGLRLYREAMRAFVVDNLKTTYGDGLWWSMGVAKHFKTQELTKLEDIFQQRDLPTNSLPQNVVGMADMLDINHFKGIIEGNWKNVFKDKLGKKSVMDGWIAEVDAARDPLAHWAGGDVARQAALRFIDTCLRVVSSIDKEKAGEIQLIWERVDKGTIGADPAPTKSAVTGLKPWRDVIVPHPDVQAGVYVKAEFAAHLGEVQKGKASDEYGKPAEFFARTYVTEGLRQLLLGVVKRLRGGGGDPVIDLKTAFGGGKTHSMLAVYHLATSPDAAVTNAEVAHIFDAAGGPPPKTAVAVFVGTDFDPAAPKRVIAEAGDVEVQTMWGEIAYQLAGNAGYQLVAEHDARGIAPGANVLEELFALAGPSVILIDELVAYLRNIPSTTRKDTLGGTYGAHMTFCQAMTEAAKKADNVALLASIPMTKIEYGDARGEDMANQISNIFQRVGAPWQPVGAREAFEVVRRRLFGPILDEAARDATCEAYFKLYRDGLVFPAECREPAYLAQMTASYPIHPEIFDRLYEDWAGNIDRFQRTRGVLRLMADVIHRLWDTKDSDPMILPGSLPLYTPNVRQQLIGYMGDNWSPPFDADVDGEGCEAALVERGNPRFGQIQACRRLTRTIFLGSVPGKAHAGLDAARIMLGVVQPNEGVSVYDDALRALTGRLSFLYGNDNRYRFEVRPNLNKVASDRISRVTGEEALEELRRRLREMKDKGDFAAVHAAPKSPSDVEDAQTARLVILGPEVLHKKDDQSTALAKAAEILDSRGTTPRIYKNMLVFMAPDVEALASTIEETKRYIGWYSISSDGKSGALALDRDQLSQANDQRDGANRTVDTRLLDAYKWLLVPEQQGTNPITWTASSVAGGGLGSIGSLALRASNKLIVDGLLIKDWSPIHLRRELDEWIWKDGRPHESLRQIWAYLSTYLYFSRLRDQEVLREAVKQGVKSRDYFGYADGVDGDKYLGLVFGEPARIVVIDESSVLVRPELAVAQQGQSAQGGELPPKEDGDGRRDEARPGPVIHDQPIRRFHASTKLNPARMSSSAGQIGDEIVQHLNALVGADVEVTLEIHAQVPDGVPEPVQRTVNENAKTLKFDSWGFEEE